jgi:hypothetical protein
MNAGATVPTPPPMPWIRQPRRWTTDGHSARARHGARGANEGRFVSLPFLLSFQAPPLDSVLPHHCHLREHEAQGLDKKADICRLLFSFFPISSKRTPPPRHPPLTIRNTEDPNYGSARWRDDTLTRRRTAERVDDLPRFVWFAFVVPPLPPATTTATKRIGEGKQTRNRTLSLLRFTTTSQLYRHIAKRTRSRPPLPTPNPKTSPPLPLPTTIPALLERRDENEDSTSFIPPFSLSFVIVETCISVENNIYLYLHYSNVRNETKTPERRPH